MNEVTFVSINVERPRRGKRRLTLGEYEHYRGRYARMAAPGVGLRSYLLGLVLNPQGPDYNAPAPNLDQRAEA